MSNIRKEIEQRLRDEIGSKRISLPREIVFSENQGRICIKLNRSGAGLGENPQNMQSDAAAFEAWSIAIKAYCGEKVQLTTDIDENDKEIMQPSKKGGHFRRFLYRAIRFEEQYGEWFELSKELKDYADDFREFLHNNEIICNVPNSIPGESGKAENKMEIYFADCNHMYEHTGSKGEVFRQLTVGLFHKEAKEDNRIFTGRKSAIDLWSIDKDTLHIVELKTNNMMIGIVTEAFFYGNLMNDLWGEHAVFIPAPVVERKKECRKRRGYDHLHTVDKIAVLMLTDEGNQHPIISDERFLEVMNDVSGKEKEKGIRYDIKTYQYPPNGKEVQ